MTRSGRQTNPAASVRARLYNLSKLRGAEFQLLLSDFAIERLLYRLGASAHKSRFVLKGAMLFKLWPQESCRASWDLDLLGRGANSIAEVVAVFKELCGLAVPDGITFDPASVKGEDIKSEDEYNGVRVRLEARLAEARIPVQVDVGFGDTAVPGPRWETYPTLLDHPPPRVLAYCRETVVAEKLDAMLTLGVINSRMKDFYDIYVLASKFAFRGQALAESIRATIERRRTPIPNDIPIALAPGFLAAPERRKQWQAFLRRGRLKAPPDTAVLGEMLRSFLWPVLVSLGKGQAFDRSWQPGGPWI